jgi:hypothetical protein
MNGVKRSAHQLERAKKSVPPKLPDFSASNIAAFSAPTTRKTRTPAAISTTSEAPGNRQAIDDGARCFITRDYQSAHAGLNHRQRYRPSPA